MDAAVLLINLLALGLVAAAGVQALHLERVAPRKRLRWAWRAMIALVAATFGLGSYTTLERYLLQGADIRAVMETLVSFLGASFMFGVVLLSRLTADNVLKMAELEIAAFTDKLTGLPNRRQFDALAPEQIEIARRRGRPLGLITLDIDYFKRVNDAYGHAWGDEILRHLGKLLAANKRKDDTAFRIGGEEFAILAPATGLDQGVAVAERLRLVIENTPVIRDGRHTAITVSFGVATLRPHDDVATLSHRADAALYAAKRAGRNRVCAEAEDELSASAPPASA